MIVATANIRVTLPRAVAEKSLAAVLDHGPRYVAVQEWGPGRNPAMQRLAHKHNMRWARVDGAGPIMWPADQRLVKIEPRRLARAGFMGWLPGRRTRLPASVAAFALIDDGARQVVVLNIHLTAEVQAGRGGYKTDAAHRARVRRHKAEVRAIARIVRRQRRKGRDVYVAGDTNFHGLTIDGLISCWRNRDGGTLGNRAVDAVYTTRPAKKVRTIATASDHDAVIVTY